MLRGAGLTVPVDSVLTFAEALGAVGLDERDGVYWAGRATLVRRPEDIAVYDRAFAVFWERRAGAGRRRVRRGPQHDHPRRSTTTTTTSDDPDDAPSRRDDPTIHAALLAPPRCCATRTSPPTPPTSCDEAQRLMAELRLVGVAAPQPAAGRRRAAHAAPARPAPHGARRAARRRRADPAALPRARRAARAGWCCCSTSRGSMEPYARALLRFVHAAVAGRQRVEAFALGTRLTRITRELSSRDPDRALAQAARARCVDWRGGTRLGDGLRRFNDEWGVRGMARGADRRDPVRRLGPGRARACSAEQMARLHRVAHRVVWVNPLKVTPGYAPLARGMAAALPYVDDFVEGHSRGRDGRAGPSDLPEVRRAMREILDDIERWRAAGKRVAVARVVDIEGSGPRDPGAAMAVTEDGEVAGSVSRRLRRGRRRRPRRSAILAGRRRAPARHVRLLRRRGVRRRAHLRRHDPPVHRTARLVSAIVSLYDDLRDLHPRPSSRSPWPP